MFGSKHKSSGTGRWLLVSTVASIVAALAGGMLYNTVKDRLFPHANEGVTNAARVGTFVGVWTTVTTKLGLKAFADKVHGLRERIGGKQ